MDRDQRRVVLYGDSLILAGVRASLEACPDLQLLSVDPSHDKSLDAIQALCPSILIFDLDAVRPDFQLSLLQQPGLTLIGMEPETHQAVVWSGRREVTLEAADLVKWCTQERNAH